MCFGRIEATGDLGCTDGMIGRLFIVRTLAAAHLFACADPGSFTDGAVCRALSRIAVGIAERGTFVRVALDDVHRRPADHFWIWSARCPLYGRGTTMHFYLVTEVARFLEVGASKCTSLWVAKSTVT
jgi:hypothetical protein